MATGKPRTDSRILNFCPTVILKKNIWGQLVQVFYRSAAPLVPNQQHWRESKALIPSRQITYWRHPSDIHQQGTGCQIPLSGRPLSRHYEIISRFPDSLQHPCPCCVTDFKHVFLSVLPVYYNATEKFSKLTLQKILLKWQYESETANDNIDVTPNLRQAMDSFPWLYPDM